ncbi:MAG: ABC transporter permease, partial [Chloroflexota bacterium]|nr:ABC transporter permease [Chloroflexota bacterium]
MKLRDTVITATQNLGRRKVRTLLTSVGVFVGIITIVTMVSLGIGIQKQVTDTIKALGLETVYVHPLSGQGTNGTDNGAGVPSPFARQRPQTPITPSTVDQFKKIAGVQSVEVMLNLPAAPEMSLQIGRGKAFGITLREQDPTDRIFSRQEVILAGKALTYEPNTRGIVLSERLLRLAGYSDKDFAHLIGQQ